MSSGKSLNVFKYTDYGDPVIYQKSDYRTANNRAHRFTLSAEKKFVPTKSHVLCEELKSNRDSYRPKSESSKEFSWKINSSRFHREDLAQAAPTVRHNHQFTDKIKTAGAIVPLNLYKSRFTDIPPFTNLPREPKISTFKQPNIEHNLKETHFTNTEGYFPHADPLVSTTQLDFCPHLNYATARTNLIVRKDLPFNSDVAFFIPESKLIKQYPLRQQYSNENVRDISRFIHPSFDRIVTNKLKFVKNFGLTSEMSSNY